ncbi:sugar phosphate nucleotidyltransferase [Chloroflexota bacterium]
MKAVILVGGEGTRLHPLTYNIVKSMMPVLNKPFIYYIFRHLHNHRINEIILAMGYKPDSIRNYFDKINSPDYKLTYSSEQTPLGTAGAIKNAEQFINPDNVFFVFNGDIFTDIDLTEMLNFHKEKNAKVTIALTPVDDPTQFGVVETDSEKRITRFTEKPGWEQVKSNYINAGIYIINNEVMNRIPENTRFMFEHDVFPKLLSDGEPVYGYDTNAYWIDMGTPEKYLQLNNDILLGKCHLSDFQIEDISIHQDSFVHPQAELTGPILIDKGCKIDKGTQLIGPLIIGSNCNIGYDTVIEKAIIWSKVHIGEKATVKNCIIGNDNSINSNMHIENTVIGHNATTHLATDN